MAFSSQDISWDYFSDFVCIFANISLCDHYFFLVRESAKKVSSTSALLGVVGSTKLFTVWLHNLLETTKT